jgi:hypothetical protein
MSHTKSIETTLRTEVTIPADDLEFAIYEHMRDAGLIKFEDENDDHPSLMCCSAQFRSALTKASKLIARDLLINIEVSV